MTPLEIGLMIVVVVVFMAYGGCVQDRDNKNAAVQIALGAFQDIHELAEIKSDTAIKLVSEMSRRMVERTAKGESDDEA